MSLPTSHALNRDATVGLHNTPERHTPREPNARGRAPCPVCAVLPGRVAKGRYAHHALVMHASHVHVGWTPERFAATWPEWYARMRAACPSCAAMGKARAVREKVKSPVGGASATPRPNLASVLARKGAEARRLRGAQGNVEGARPHGDAARWPVAQPQRAPA